MNSSVFSSGDLEKRLRKAHRAELEASPELRREFKRARKSESTGFTRISRNLLMPIFWASIFLAMVHRQNNVGWAAGVIAHGLKMGTSLVSTVLRFGRSRGVESSALE